MKQWSTLRKLLLLRLIMGGGIQPETFTVSGTSPLSLANAIAHSILSLTQTGKCSQASTPTPTSPVDIYCNNGAVKYGALGTNLLNADIDTTGAYINASGELVSGTGFRYSAIIPVKAGKYTLSGTNNPYSGNTKRVHAYLNGVWQSQLAAQYFAANAAFSVTFTVPSGVNGIRLSYMTGDVDVMIEAGETATEYEAYVGGIYADGTPEVITVTHADSTTETASAVDLFAIDSTRADTQDIISGLVTRNCGIKVFDGTEDWSRTSARAQVQIEDSAIGSSTWTPICSHYKTYGASTTLANMDDNSIKYNGSSNTILWKDSTHNTDIDAWKAWVKSQYELGTPIILIYPLAEPTTETATAQPLSTTAGTNTVSWTAEVSGKTMSAEYKGSTANSNKVGTGKVGYMKI